LLSWKLKTISGQIQACITSYVPMFYYTDPSGVGWALPLFTSPSFGAHSISVVPGVPEI
jgi:hypothetical protein